ncbi:hypothetical protein [Pantoea agglomerans]|uniref:hypothetical protein n=1 Tax=Enterobacter agglomerans TaxID=549 RepID=UPI000A93F546|nr:hypothetical protein [Pantoea agglomerans]
MTDDEFDVAYPHHLYRREHIRSRAKGTMGQTEIDEYRIIVIETGEELGTATRTEHTNGRGKTTVTWK